MGRDYTYVDNLFLKVFAVVVKRDTVILPVHPESALVNKEFTWVFGTYYFNSEKSGALCPLFLGYFEDTHFKSPHYQSVVPTGNSNVLKTIKSNDGFDVAKEFGFPESSVSTG